MDANPTFREKGEPRIMIELEDLGSPRSPCTTWHDICPAYPEGWLRSARASQLIAVWGGDPRLGLGVLEPQAKQAAQALPGATVRGRPARTEWLPSSGSDWGR